MSNVLAIASVTRLLRDLLNDALVNGDIAAVLGTSVLVTSQPPDRLLGDEEDGEDTRLNVYLHRITKNAALANSDLPSRDSGGRLVDRPRLALDLHYLLTAYSSQDLHAEILLGYAMQLFHENPILARGAVRQALQNGVNGSILPQAFQSVQASRLADQIELIKITFEPLSLDDMSKVWTALQTNYRMTVSYQVSVVLIEREMPRRDPLPVLSRGPVDPLSGREAGVASSPSLLPSVPTLCAVEPAGGQPAARLGEVLTLGGFSLDQGEARARFRNPESGQEFDLSPIDPPTPEQVRVLLPGGSPLAADHPLAGTGADPGTWRVGTYQVRLVHSGAELPTRESNALSFTLAPRATPAAAAVPQGVEITVDCQPRIRAGQPVAIVVGQDDTQLEDLENDADSVSVTRDDLQSGTEVPVRLRVAGVDSLLIDRNSTPPAYDASQIVQIP